MNVICSREKEMPAGLYQELSAYRRKVFVDRLGWELHCAAGGEQDQFDSHVPGHAQDAPEDLLEQLIPA